MERRHHLRRAGAMLGEVTLGAAVGSWPPASVGRRDRLGADASRSGRLERSCMSVEGGMRRVALLLMLAAASTMSGCYGSSGGDASDGGSSDGGSSDGGSNDSGMLPDLEPSGIAFWEPRAFSIGESDARVRLDNVGAANLILSAFEGDFDDRHTLSWGLGADPGELRVGIRRGQNEMPEQIVVTPGQTLTLQLSGPGPESGRVVMTSNDPGNRTIEIPIVRQTVPVIAEPSSVSFGFLVEGEEAHQILSITNATDTVVDFSDVRIEAADWLDCDARGDQSRWFAAQFSEDSTLHDPGADGFAGLDPGATTRLVVTFSPFFGGEHLATLVVTFDGALPLRVPLRTSAFPPCIDVIDRLTILPQDVEPRLATVRIESCGGAELVVSAIDFADDSSNAFRVRVDGLPRTLRASDAMGPNDGFDVDVEFDPPDDEPHTGALMIETNAGIRWIDVFGRVVPE